MVETFFTEKRIIKKIIIAIVFIFMFNFTFSYLGNNVVFATDVGSEGATKVKNDYEMEEGGGKLLLPIHALILFITDAVLELMQNSFISSDSVTIKAYSKDTSKVNGWAIAGIVIGVVVLAVACVVTYGAAAAAVGSVTTAVAGTTGAVAIGTAATAIGTAAATYGGTVVGGIIFAGGAIAGIAYSTDTFIDDIEGEYELPTIQYTPEAIFSNRIPLFNINFFNPNQSKTEIKTVTTKEITTLSGTRIVNDGVMDLIDKNTKTKDGKETYYNESTSNYDYNKIYDDYVSYNQEISDCFAAWYRALGKIERTATVTNILATYGDVTTFTSPSSLFLNNLYDAYTISDINKINNAIRSCNEGYKNVVKLINEIELNKLSDEDKEKLANEISTLNLKIENKEVEEVVATYQSSSNVLQSTVASMYKTLRTVAIVALLSILVYVGIRMVLSSASKDKAKYKQMLIDWLVAFIILFVLHYIMAFIIDISENLTEICNKSNVENVPIAIPNGTKIQDENGELVRLDGGDDSKGDVWGTNFIGAIRFYAGLVQKNGYTIKGISYTLMYLVLVIYVVMFSFQYMKRVLYMAFLTMISPLVAITYPLDKINDGKAQGFSMWLKEYIFNALLQPIHYIIYVIIMGSVMDMVVDHPVYALVALGFMLPAEKFIRKMFGFEKASTVGTFGAAAGAAALMGGLQKLRHNPHGKKNDDNGAKGDKDDPNGKIRTISAMPDGPNNPGGGNGGLPGGSNAPRPGEEGFIGPLPYDRNSTLLGMPQTTHNENNNNLGWDSRLTPEQKDYLEAEGLTPGTDDYNNALRNYGINPEESVWDPRLTQEQIDYAREKDIYEPKGQEYEQFLGELGYGRNTISGGTPTPTPRPQPRPNPEPTVDLMTYATPRPRPRPTPSTGARRNIYNKPNGFINGVRAVGGHYKRRLDNRLRKAHPLRALRRGLTFGAGALTLGTIGLAAGIASGDPSKALQYTVAGGAAGGYLGRNIGETASNIVGLEGAAKSFKAGALGDEYDKLERAKYKRDFKNNVSNYDVGVRSVGVDGWKDMSKDGGIIDTGIDYGINNVNDLGNIYKAKEEFRNQYGMTDEEAQDWAFKAYKLDQNFGDWSKNSKTRENLDKLLKAKGYTDDTQREDVTKKMVETMGVYQNVALDKEIEEIKPDYTRITRQTEDTVITGSNNSHGDNGSNDNEREYQDEHRDSYQPEIPIQQSTINEQEEIARRANAESEANRAAVRQKEENRKIQEELEARAKADKKAERRARAETARQRSQQAKEKRKGMETKNGELGNPKASNAIDPDRRVVKPKTKDVNPISSDPGNNGNGPINTL